MPGSRRSIEDEEAAAKVARAVASVRRAVGRLVGLLGQEEPAVYEATALALHELGAAAAIAG